MSEYTALVLGAGASLSYGYPLGSELKDEILKISAYQAFTPSDQFSSFGLLSTQYPHEDEVLLAKFQNEFSRSGADSIDTFLGHRPEFMEIGKKCIAMVLLKRENEDWLFRPVAPKWADKLDDWYSYFWNRYKTRDWSELNFSDIKIVTFNYDRSLEQYLLKVLQHLHDKTQLQAMEKLATLEIVHVYGSLGATLPGMPGYANYSNKLDRARIEQCVKSMSLIRDHKGVEDSSALAKSREILKSAKNIAFLGFGFDDTNVERIGADKVCNATYPRPIKLIDSKLMATLTQKTRQLVGTSIGLSDAQCRKNYLKLAGEQFEPITDRPLHNLNCTDLLRETLILD